MSQTKSRPAGRKVLLMATCLSDVFFADMAKATVEVLEAVGCEVIFPEAQTCCGQPAFNSGDFPAAEKIGRYTAEVFAGDLPVIVPSGSCAAMHFHGSQLLFEDKADTEEVESLAGRTWELFDFLVNGLGVKQWAGTLNKKIALHHSCHTRGSDTGAAMETLLSSIEGVELVEVGTPEQCCGFGGTFSVTFPHLSGEIGQVKLDSVLEQSPDLLVSADMSCLMHMGGLAEKQNKNIETRHAVQVLRDVGLKQR
ncbi:MAG: (Fe-S)-binding protein [Verrucomicrobiales bacterium]|nr:(Fe-S)-binding protein [Verrucomicrobiales bacterium]